MPFTATGAYIADTPQGYTGVGGGGGFNFNINRTSSQQQPAQQPVPSYSGGGTQARGGGGGAYGIASGQYASPQAIQEQENEFRTQQRSLDAQKSLAQMGYDNQASMQRMQIEAQERARMQAMEALQNMTGQFQGQWGAAQQMPPMPQFQPVQIQGQRRETLQAPDMQAANRAAFARAKDQAGLMAQSALTGLRSSLGGRGLLGSGAELRGTANVAQRGLGELGDVNREQAITNAGLSNQNAMANYQGQIAQRGQDQSMANQVAQMNFQQQVAAQEMAQRNAERQQQYQMDMQRQMMEMALSSLRY